MKISEYFNLGMTQRQLDFVDIYLETDIPLFLDPVLISKKNDRWSTEAHATIKDYFQFLINTIKQNKIAEAQQLFSYLNEPNETKLGLSKGQSKGKGVGKSDTNRVFKRLIKSKAIESGLVEDLEDTVLFVDRIGRDKISDLTTNIIKWHLIEYTQRQCELFDIPLTEDVQSGFYWNRINSEWENVYTKYLIIEGKKILLVPKSIVCYQLSYIPQKFHQHFILEYLQADHLRRETSFVRTRFSKGGVATKFVTKKDLKERVAPQTKEFIRKFTTKHPRILEDYKKNAVANAKPLKHQSFEEFNQNEFCDFLITRLNSISVGKKAASEYHSFVIGLLDFLFYPDLVTPVKEERIHNGRKRIDIVFDNAATDGFFYQLHTTKGISCQYIVFECKNYEEDPKNPEVDQVTGRFSPNRGKFGVIVCRNLTEKKVFLNRCSDTYKDQRGLVLYLTDEDFINALGDYKQREYRSLQKILIQRMREVIMS